MKYSKTIGLLSLCGHLLFAAAFLLLHVLRPDKSVMSSFTSEYAAGDFGWIMTIGFFAVTAGALFLIIGLLQQFKASRTSLVSLSTWCIAMFLTGLFKTDLPGAAPTPQGLIHGIAALLAFICLGIAMISWGTVFRKNKNWYPFGKTIIDFWHPGSSIVYHFFHEPAFIPGSHPKNTDCLGCMLAAAG